MQNFTPVGGNVAEISVPGQKKTNPTKSILALRLPDKNGTKILHIINQLEYWS